MSLVESYPTVHSAPDGIPAPAPPFEDTDGYALWGQNLTDTLLDGPVQEDMVTAEENSEAQDEPLEDILRRAQARDELAFNTLWRRCQESALRAALELLDHERAVGVVQMTGFKVYRALEQYELPSEAEKVEPYFRAWVKVIARNTARDELKHGAHQVGTVAVDFQDEVASFGLHEQEAPEGSFAETIEGRSAVDAALDRIPKQYARVVEAVDVLHLTNTQYAEITGLSRSTVGSQLNRGRALLRDIIASGAIEGLRAPDIDK